MKKIAIHIIALIFPLIAVGQSKGQNYIKTRTHRLPSTEGVIDTLINVKYYDGLGRPIQTVAVKAAGNGNDIVTPILYDGLGRQSKQYLPYVTQLAMITSPNYRDNAGLITSINTTYLNNYPNDLSNSEPNPYSESLFEAGSPLNRVIEQASPGILWKGNSASDTDHTVKFDYLLNTALEVRNFSVELTGSTGESTNLVYKGTYPAGRLYKTITKDENWQPGDGKDKTTEEFKDKEGRLLLKRAYDNGLKHDTYYVYDSFGNLSYVIPPTGSDNIIEQYLLVSQASVNFPWTKLTKVDQTLAGNYDAALANYDNSQILNVDLMQQYGGKGGFSIIPRPDGRLVFNINVTTARAMPYNTGVICDLNPFGIFSDYELGRITGPGYDYTFLVQNNQLEVVGSGDMPSFNFDFTGDTPLVYSEIYPFTKVCALDAIDARDYEDAIKNLSSGEILTTYTYNKYGAMGGFSVNLDEQDVLNVSLNITATTPLELVNGMTIPLNIERGIEDRDLGVAEGEHNGMPYHYEFQVLNNNLHITGSGSFTHLGFFASKLAKVNGTIKQETIDGLCYIYHYDHRNRRIEKKIPGKGWEWIVYDRLDRPVLTQDTNLKAKGKWLFTNYDKLGRVAYTGMYSSAMSRVEEQLIFNDSRQTPDLYVTKAKDLITIGTNTIDYGWLTHLENVDIYTVNYYDDYLSTSNMSVPQSVYDETRTTNARSLSTVTDIRILGTNLWIYSATGYNNKGQVIYTASKNELFQTLTQIQNKLDFQGKELRKMTTLSKPGDTAVSYEDIFTYDYSGRPLKHTQITESQTEQLIAWNQYDLYGQLKQKKVGGTTLSSYSATNTGLQIVDFNYNIRGWLQGINNINADLNSSKDLFSFGIDYSGLYNGNISGTSWKSKLDNKLKTYIYGYDALNRLTDATFWGNVSLTENFREGPITYDKNGNIKSLQRWGYYGTNLYDKIDQLVYSYKPMSNQLATVTDNSGYYQGFADDFNLPGDDYEYDSNGNMVMDHNKGLGLAATEKITYNHLNLPTTVIKDTNHRIELIYDATGRKLQKKFINASETTTTQYAEGGFVYEKVNQGANTIQYFPHAEGYARRETDGSFSYIYQYKDHLGNVRLSYADTDGDGVINDTQKFSDGFEGENNWNATWNGYGSYLNPLVIDNQKTPHSGNRCAKLTSPGPGEAYSHSAITLEVNNNVATEYIYSGWYYSDGPAVEMYLFMNEENETFYYTDLNRIIATTVGTGKWEYIEKKILVQPNIKKINLRLDVNSTGSVWFDDVSIRRATIATEIISENSYYPFGMIHKGPNNVVLSSDIGLKLKFQGQERQDEMGLNWDSFKWRNYDYAIGRFFNIDPLAEKYEYNGVYNFQENKIGMGRELEGLELVPTTSKDGKSATVNYYVNPQNNSRLSDKDFQELVEARADLIEKSWVGENSKGVNITSVNVYCDPQATVSWEYNELISVTGTEQGNARGFTLRKGDKNNNRTQVNVFAHLGGNNGELMPLTPKTKKKMTKTGAHEDLHVAGIPDIRDNTNPQLEYEMANDPKGNVMDEPTIDSRTNKPVIDPKTKKPEVDGTNVTPHQRDFILRITTPLR